MMERDADEAERAARPTKIKRRRFRAAALNHQADAVWEGQGGRTTNGSTQGSKTN
jgi:hypothetical protein